MRTLRRRIQLKDGVEVDTLFTPHLFSYKDEKGLTLETDTSSFASVIEAYADIYYLAAINAWELDDKGGKTAKQLVAEQQAKEQPEAEAPEQPESKKKASRWIGRILRRS